MSKVRRRVLPASLLILIFANVDKGNLGFVANQLCRDLNLTHSEYGTGASAFFAGFVFSRIPSNLALRYFGAPFWLTALMFSWGILAASLGFITHVHHFYVARFLLGIAEGGAFPGVWSYVAEFFPDEHLSYAYSFIALARPIASSLSGPLAALFLSFDGMFGIASWRYMFFVEGIVPALCAPLLYTVIPKCPNTIPQLSSEERSWLQSRLKANNKATERNLWEEVWLVLRNRDFWILIVSGWLRGTMFSMTLYWTSLMIEDTFANAGDKDHATCAASHSTSATGMAVTSLVFILSEVVTLVIGHSTRAFKNRGPAAGWITILAGASIGIWNVMRGWSVVLGLLILSVAVSAEHGNGCLIVGLLVGQFEPQIKSTALALYATIECVGNLFGPLLTGNILDQNGDYGKAALVTGALEALGGALLFAVSDPLRQRTVRHKETR